MQAIRTKYFPVTNHRGSRVKASCERGSLTTPWDHALNPEENHRAAIVALLRSFVAADAKHYGTSPTGSPWARDWVMGGSNGGWMAVQAAGRPITALSITD